MQWAPAAYRDAVLRSEVQDVLDWLVGRFRMLRGFEDELRVASGAATSAGRLAFVVRSLSECHED